MKMVYGGLQLPNRDAGGCPTANAIVIEKGSRVIDEKIINAKGQILC